MVKKNNENSSLQLPENVLLIIEDYIQENSGDNVVDVLELTDFLNDVYLSKFNINVVDKTDLHKLQLLNDVLINNFITYRDKIGPFLSIYELQAIPGFDSRTIDRILPFLTFEKKNDAVKTNLTSSVSNASHELLLRSQRNLEQLAGSKEGDFLGDPYRHFLRYRLKSDYLRAGIVAEKDIGEAFFSGNNKSGFDFYSAHLAAYDLNENVKEVILGDYTVSMGQGLILHNQFGGGLSSFTTNIKRRNQAFRPYTARNEVNYFRGIATDILINSKIKAKAFASINKVDGTLRDNDNNDTFESFSSINTSGNHRTLSEVERKNRIRRNSYGGIIQFESNATQISANFLIESFDKTFDRSFRLDNTFFPQTKNFQNFSIDYSHVWNNIHFFGESAISGVGGTAHLIGVLMALHPKVNLAATYRNYAKDYIALNPNGFGQGSNTTNEIGSYLGLEYRLNKFISVNAYADMWRNPWLRFRVDRPGTGTDYLIKVNYNIKRKLDAYFLFKTEQRLRNSSLDSNIDFATNERISRTRLHISYAITKAVRLRNRIEYSFYKNDTESPNGLLIYQDIIYKPINKPFSFTSRLLWFDIKDFDARIYTYENDVLNDFFVPFFNGNGIRYYFNARYRPNYRTTLELRWAQIRYFDREQISSGVSEIEGSINTNIKAQIRYRF